MHEPLDAVRGFGSFLCVLFFPTDIFLGTCKYRNFYVGSFSIIPKPYPRKLSIPCSTEEGDTTGAANYLFPHIRS